MIFQINATTRFFFFKTLIFSLAEFEYAVFRIPSHKPRNKLDNYLAMRYFPTSTSVFLLQNGDIWDWCIVGFV